MNLSTSQRRALDKLRRGLEVTKGKGFRNTLLSLERRGLAVKIRGRWYAAS